MHVWLISIEQSFLFIHKFHINDSRQQQRTAAARIFMRF